jgi:fucose permease
MKNKLKIISLSVELACVISLLFFFGYHISSLGPKEFAKQMGLAVGITAEVPSNQYNTLAQALKERDTAVTEREKLLAEKEATVLREQKEANAKISFLVIGIGSVLLGLILFNFYLDAKRKKDSDYTVKIKSP